MFSDYTGPVEMKDFYKAQESKGHLRIMGSDGGAGTDLPSGRPKKRVFRNLRNKVIGWHGHYNNYSQ